MSELGIHYHSAVARLPLSTLASTHLLLLLLLVSFFLLVIVVLIIGQLCSRE